MCTFGGLEQTDTGLNLSPVLAVLLGSVLYHQLVHFHRDYIMVVCTVKKKTHRRTYSIRSNTQNNPFLIELKLLTWVATWTEAI